ncbi:MAG: VOC family protein [Roseivirga sp.]|nr:VOC family protein [Roseivirga sp.]
MLHKIDHLLYSTKDLSEGIDHIHRLTGVKPVIGGSHPGLGTHNALLGLDHNIYLEIIAPDPNQDVDRVWMDLDQLENPKLFRWAASSTDVKAVRDQGLKAGFDIGEVKSGSRYKPDGSLLEWTLSDPNVNLGDGLVPFFIDWGAKGNPTPGLPTGCRLEAFEAVHPEPEKIKSMLTTLGLDLETKTGISAQLIAKLQTPKGLVVLS